jgi:hypothetical protein
MEHIEIAEINYHLILLPQYRKDLKRLKRLEPKLHAEVRESLKAEIESGKLDEIKETGGWVKGRAGSPTRNMGKSGGFRFIYLLFRVQHDIYLQTVYDHRPKKDLTPDEKKELKAAAVEIKKAYELNEGKK